ncbi:hypothetical protein Q6350_05280 [Isoptericola sp. b515]|uniref:zf-HC2 domain-containing protein n=1 Tax=Isoptericola sp. b515 TaxID=3064652 RepID=UPI002712FCF2|nr:zf-HC2 domain-containing protein [Isoptericola sp. b515]MDO8147839.1 hypothetical protein [Isoptericola sp. b515]
MSARKNAVERSSGAVERARQLRAAAAAAGHDDGPGAAGTVDPDVVRTALATLSHDDQRLLGDRYVAGRRLEVVARELGIPGRSASRRLGHAEDRFARALAAAHARGGSRRACVETRHALPGYVGHRLGGGRRQLLEDHLFGCSGCLRAFVEVRGVAWALQDVAPALRGAPVPTVRSLPAVLGAPLTPGPRRGLLPGPVPAAVGRTVAVAAAVGVVAVAIAAGTLLDGGGALDGTSLPVPAAMESSSSAPAPQVTMLLSPDPSASAQSPGVSPTSSPSPSSSASSGPVPDPDPTPSASTSSPGDEPTSQESSASVPPASTPPRGSSPGTTSAPSPEPTRSASSPSAPVPASEPVTTTVALDVSGRGTSQVVPTGGGQIVDVSPRDGNVRVQRAADGSWSVSTRGSSTGVLDVRVTGPGGSAPGALLVPVD